MKVNNWEDAVDQLADENADLRATLNSIITLWELEAPLPEIENAINRAAILLKNLPEQPVKELTF